MRISLQIIETSDENLIPMGMVLVLYWKRQIKSRVENKKYRDIST